MTGILLNSGIDAVKEINEINLTLMKNEDNLAFCKRIEKCLMTLTDVLQEAFMDMVRVDKINERIEELNKRMSDDMK